MQIIWYTWNWWKLPKGPIESMSLNLWHLAFPRSNIDFIKTYTYSIGCDLNRKWLMQITSVGFEETNTCMENIFRIKNIGKGKKPKFIQRIVTHKHTRNSFEFDLGFKITIYANIYLFQSHIGLLAYWRYTFDILTYMIYIFFEYRISLSQTTEAHRF